MTPLFIIWFLVAVALLFDFLNGMHDAANSIATIVSTRVLKPLLYDPAHRDRVLTEAQRLVGVQTQRRALGQPALEAAKVIASLRAATQADTGFVPGRASSSVVSAPSGAPLFRIIPKAGNKAILELVLGSPATNADFQAAFERAIHELRPQE